MPIYEYHCKSCNQDFENLIVGNWKPKCPHCGAHYAKKLMSAPSIIDMGDEWSGLRARTGCKGFEVTTPDGRKLPMYNKHKP